MTDLAEKTESLRDYAEMLGSPDPNTTGRMRARLDDYMLRRRALRRRRVRLALGLFALVSAIGIAVALGLRDHTPLAITAESERTIEIGSTRLILRPGASVRADENDPARVELVAGEIEMTLAPGQPFVVTSGEFEVQARIGRMSVRHTDALPVVTVERGEALLLGPGLPTTGVRVLESPAH